MTDPLTILGLERGDLLAAAGCVSTATASPTWSPSSPGSAKPNTGQAYKHHWRAQKRA